MDKLFNYNRTNRYENPLEVIRRAIAGAAASQFKKFVKDYEFCKDSFYSLFGIEIESVEVLGVAEYAEDNSLYIGSRTKLFLRQSNCDCMPKLFELSISDLMRKKYMDQKSLGEILDILENYARFRFVATNQKVNVIEPVLGLQLANTEISYESVTVANTPNVDVDSLLSEIKKLEDKAKLYKFFKNDKCGTIPLGQLLNLDIDKVSSIPTVEYIKNSAINVSKKVETLIAHPECETLGNLLSLSFLDLLELKGSGAKTILDLLPVVKHIASTGTIKIPVVKTISESERRKNFKDFILERINLFLDRVEHEVGNKKLAPYVRNYAVINKTDAEAYLFPYLKDDLIIKDYPSLASALLDNLVVSEIETAIVKLQNFENWIEENLPFRLLDNIFVKTKPGKDYERIFDILVRRSRKETLDDIGATYGITRQRANQIDTKETKRIANLANASYSNLMASISSYVGGLEVISKETLQQVTSSYRADILWYSISERLDEQGPYGYYDKSRDLYIMTNEVGDVAVLEDKVNNFIDSLPDVIEIDAMEYQYSTFAEENNLPLEFVERAINNVYKQTGKLLHKETLKVMDIIAYILKHKFERGFKVSDEASFKKYLKYRKELVGLDDEVTMHSVEARVQAFAVLVDRGVYVHKDFIRISPEQIEKIKKAIDNHPLSTIPFKVLYNDLKTALYGSSVVNQYAMQGVIKLYFPEYVTSRDYLYRDGSGSIELELSDFLQNNGVTHKSKIFKEFKGWNDANLGMIVPRCPDVIGLDGGYYMHSSLVKIDSNTKIQITKYLQKTVKGNPVSSRFLLAQFKTMFPDFLKNNNIDNHSKLFGILRYLFSGHYYFSRPYLSKEEGELTNKKFVITLTNNQDTISLSKIAEAWKKAHNKTISISSIVDSLVPLYIRIDEDTMVRYKNTGIEEYMFEDIIELMNEKIKNNGGYLTAGNIDSYDDFPKLNVPWNFFILENIASICDSGLVTIKNISSRSDISHTIFVDNKFKDDDYNSLVVKVLLEQHNAVAFSDKDDVHEWLKSEGLCFSKLPEFLITENHVYTDASGKFVVE